MPVNPINCELGSKASNFKLLSVNEKTYTLNELKGETRRQQSQLNKPKETLNQLFKDYGITKEYLYNLKF